ncbi:hypothetical protein CM1200mP19_0780 [bacterium]|nr:MAG: hypothetical protein CM1200mP19_0780 [bacterium]
MLDHVMDQISSFRVGIRALDLGEKLVSANAYVGADPIVDLLAEGCQFPWRQDRRPIAVRWSYCLRNGLGH